MTVFKNCRKSFTSAVSLKNKGGLIFLQNHSKFEKKDYKVNEGRAKRKKIGKIKAYIDILR